MSFYQFLVVIFPTIVPFLKELLFKELETNPQSARAGDWRRYLFLAAIAIALTVGTFFLHQHEKIEELEKKIREKPETRVETPLSRMHSEDYLQRMVLQEQLRTERENTRVLTETLRESRRRIETLEELLKLCSPPTTTPQPKPSRSRIRDRLDGLRDKEN